MCIYCNTITMHHATKSLCGEYVWVSKWAAQLKTILVAKWEVPVSKRERLPKWVVTKLKSKYINIKKRSRKDKLGLDSECRLLKNEVISLGKLVWVYPKDPIMYGNFTRKNKLFKRMVKMNLFRKRNG